MASMSELVKIYDEQQRLSSRIDVLEEEVRGLKHAASAPKPPVSVPVEPVEQNEPDGAPIMVSEEELAKYRGKPGRKPKHIQEALAAEEKAA